MNEPPVDMHAYHQSNKISPCQRTGLRALGVGDDRILIDCGLIDINRACPELRLALLSAALVQHGAHPVTRFCLAGGEQLPR
jgi:hypothetical protein